MIDLDRPGRFKVDSVPMGIKPGKDGKQSIQAIFDFTILEMWDAAKEKWVPWNYGMHILGYLTIVKNDGTPNTTTAESLIKFMGWSGDLSSLDEGSMFRPEPCQITVAESEYQGKTSLKVEWVNAWDSEGGKIKKADPATVKQLAAKHGATFRALAGNLKRNTGVPSVKTPPPSKVEIPDSAYFDPNAPEFTGAGQ